MRIVLRPCHEGIGIHPGFGEPSARDIEPAVAGILAHVARDVGELHRHAKIASPGDRGLLPASMMIDIMTPTVPATRTA